MTALEGAIALVALLTRVDGAVVMDTDLRILGFGCEIITNKGYPKLFIVRTSRAHRSRSTRVSADSFGTRHRSIFRYCTAVPGSVGFVVSQDGPVRAVTMAKNCLVMWANIGLSRHLVPINEEASLEVRQ